MPIAANALGLLKRSGYSELRKVSAHQKDGSIVLTGRVNSFYHKQMAQEIIRSVVESAGLRVDNRIEVDGWKEAAKAS